MIAILSLILTILGILGTIFSPTLYEKIKPYLIKVRRLDIYDDKELDDFFSIYNNAFKEKDGYDNPAFLIQSLEEDEKNSRHVQCDEIYLVAKYNSSIIGFIACYYYPSKECAIIGYLANSTSNVELGKFVGSKFAKKLKHILPKECKYMIYEIDDKSLNGKEILFTRYVKNMKLNTYKVAFNIVRPKIDLDDNTEGELKLYIIPMSDNITGDTISKTIMLELLDFMLFCCYGDHYKETDDNHIIYQNYLKTKYENYSKILPERIPLLCITKGKANKGKRGIRKVKALIS
jgi:hypothetical protein